MGLFKLDESIHDVINRNAIYGVKSFNPKRGLRQRATDHEDTVLDDKNSGLYNKENKSKRISKYSDLADFVNRTKNKMKDPNSDKDEFGILRRAATGRFIRAHEASELLDESIHDMINMNSFAKHISDGRNPASGKVGTGAYKGLYDAVKKGNKEAISLKHAVTKGLKSGINRHNMFSRKELGVDKTATNMLSKYASTSKHFKESYDGLNEETEGVSLSTKKLVSAGDHNSSDLNAVKPNAEYCDQYDKHFIGDGEDPETSKVNVPAVLAARTAGGDPFDQTMNNGINKASADVFHLKKLRDDEGMNG